MSSSSPNLPDLRARIDRLDQEILSALQQRMRMMDQVAAAKQASSEDPSPMRPDREAQILRRLKQRHDGGFPFAMALRIWREIVNTASTLQGDISVAVCAPEKSVGYWDLARNHFGSVVPMSLHRSPSLALRRVSEEPGVVGLLPLPHDGDDDPWWLHLANATQEPDGLRIIWRLPFFHNAPGRFEDLSAYAVAKAPLRDSGDDMTVALIETRDDSSRGRLLEVLEKQAIKAHPLAIYNDALEPARLNLLELDGHIAQSDRRFAACREEMGEALRRITILGAYPRSIEEPPAATAQTPSNSKG